MGCAPQVQLWNLALIKNLISLPGNLHPFRHSSDSWFPAFWDLGRAWWNSFHIAYFTCKFEETVLRQVSGVGPSPSSGAWASPFPSLSLSIRIWRWAGKTLQQGDSTVFNGMMLDCGKPLVNKWLSHSLTHGSKAGLQARSRKAPSIEPGAREATHSCTPWAFPQEQRSLNAVNYLEARRPRFPWLPKQIRDHTHLSKISCSFCCEKRKQNQAWHQKPSRQSRSE